MGRMKRVNKANPCPACGKDSWCLYDENSTLCMRNSAGRLHLLKSGEQGWWHDVREGDPKRAYPPPQKEPVVPKIDAEAMMRAWIRCTKPMDINDHADELGVKPSSLIDVGVRWAGIHRAWAWPMRDASGKTCGIRLRSQEGRKWSVAGSKSGVFLPSTAPQRTAYIVEGPSDLCAILSMNLWGIGRPSCSGGTDEINATIKRLGIREAVIIADNDEDKTIGGRTYNPGADGGMRLSERLCVPNCLITLPVKDSREFLKMGGTREILESLTQNTVWSMAVY